MAYMLYLGEQRYLEYWVPASHAISVTQRERKSKRNNYRELIISSSTYISNY